MTYRILITGSRAWNDYNKVSKVLTAEVAAAIKLGLDVVVVHGDCPTGADAITQRLCEEMSIITERHPADWSKHGRAAGPLRNQEMVDLGADICYAYSLPESRGTKDCKARAEKAGIPVVELGMVE